MLKKIISHRGNLDGKSEFENTINQILKSIEYGFDVEIDLWYVNNKLFLGHDNPQQECSLEFLNDNSEKLWIHAKNVEACEYFLQQNILIIYQLFVEYISYQTLLIMELLLYVYL
jgi:hypothetical protein